MVNKDRVHALCEVREPEQCVSGPTIHFRLSTDVTKGYILPLPILFPSPCARLLVFLWRRIASELSRNVPFEYVLHVS